MKQLNISKIFTIVLPLFATISISFIPYKQVLSFEYKNTGKVLAYIPLEQAEIFQIIYTHSIHLSDVVETYKIDLNGYIHQIELEYDNFSIGMPSNAYGDEKFIQRNGKYVITNMDRKYPFLDIRVGQIIANHRLIIKKQAVSFSEFVEPGTWTRLKVRKINIWQQLKGVNILERERKDI
jgi:hypothetical protein